MELSPDNAENFIGPINVPDYVNMNLALEELEIVGSESHGDYWDRLDPATGRTIAHRVFRLGPPGFQPPRATP